MHPRAALCAPLLLAACQRPLIWDLAAPSDTVDDLLVALLVARYDGDAEQIAGPHAVGSVVAIHVIHPRSRFNFDGWGLASDDESVVTVGPVQTSDNRISAELWFTGEGYSSVSVLRPNGRSRGSQPVEAAFATDTRLFAADDLRTGGEQEADVAGELHLAGSSELSLAVAMFDAEGRALTGNRALSVQLDPIEQASDTDAPVSLTAEVREGDTLRSFDAFDLRAEGEDGATSSLAVQIGGREVERWRVVVHPRAALDQVSLAERSASGGRYCVASSFAGVHRVLGLPLSWTDEAGNALGDGTYLTVEPGPPATVTACVPDTETCATLTLSGAVGYVGDALAPLCGCQTGRRPGAAFALWLAGAALLRRRRTA